MRISKVYEQIDIVRNSILSNFSYDVGSKEGTYKWVLKGLPVIRNYKQDGFKKVVGDIAEIIDTIPDAKSGEILISTYNKPAGELFEMSYLKMYQSYIIRAKGETIVFQDESDMIEQF